MEYLLIYETVEGQTRKIVEAVARQLQVTGHSVKKFDAADRLASLPLEGVDKVILAAPVHERRHPKGFEVLVSASKADLAALPTLMISVSIKAAFAKGLEEARDYLIEMEMRTGLTPTMEILAAGAVRTSSYSYYESQILQNVVLDGQSVDLVDGVHEFTDWDQLCSDVDAFMKL